MQIFQDLGKDIELLPGNDRVKAHGLWETFTAKPAMFFACQHHILTHFRGQAHPVTMLKMFVFVFLPSFAEVMPSAFQKAMRVRDYVDILELMAYKMQIAYRGQYWGPAPPLCKLEQKYRLPTANKVQTRTKKPRSFRRAPDGSRRSFKPHAGLTSPMVREGREFGGLEFVFTEPEKVHERGSGSQTLFLNEGDPLAIPMSPREDALREPRSLEPDDDPIASGPLGGPQDRLGQGKAVDLYRYLYKPQERSKLSQGYGPPPAKRAKTYYSHN